jgi:tRNA (mo5U34)-methyltransferase
MSVLNSHRQHLHTSCDFDQLSQIESAAQIWRAQGHGRKLLPLFERLPNIQTTHLEINQTCPQIGKFDELDSEGHRAIHELIEALSPWKKGPFELFGQMIDSEWRSDMKWDRLAPHLPPLKNKCVLDVGANNGYFSLRLAGLGPKLALGIDPFIPSLIQSDLIQYFAKLPQWAMGPWGLEHMPLFGPSFDLILYMGVLYHHPDPIDQLKKLKMAMTSNGVAIVETIGLPGHETKSERFEGRYAGMKNVYDLPTLSQLELWLKEAGFHHIALLSTQWGEQNEQRRTTHAKGPSYQERLDPNDDSRTIEGHPAPERFLLAVKA